MGGYIRDGGHVNRVGWCILGEKLDKERERKWRGSTNLEGRSEQGE